MRTIFLLLFIFMASVSGAETGRQFIFLVHGIAGNYTHFGHMPEVLSEHFPDALVYPIDFSTGNDNKTTQDFSQEIYDKMQSLFVKNGGLRDSDRISFVVHSEGGLVVSRLIFNIYHGEVGYDSGLKNNIKSLVTVGTPFWGAKTAELGDLVKAWLTKLHAPLVQLFGAQELKDMRFNSESIYRFRQALLEPQNQSTWQEIFKNIRILQIAGTYSQLNFLSLFVDGYKTYEDDTAVPLAAAHFNFQYFTDRFQPHQGPVLLTDFKEFKPVSNFVIVNALHLSPFPENPKYYGEIWIPEHCQKIESCDHPVYPLIYNFFKSENDPVAFDQMLAKRPVPKLTSFILSLNIRFPEHVSAVDRGLARFKFGNAKQRVTVATLFQLFSKEVEWTDDKTLRVHFSGQFTAGQAEDILDLYYNNKKVLEVPVTAGQTTFVDVSSEVLKINYSAKAE